MKGCFLLQRRWAFMGHNLALILREKYGLDQFCGYVFLRSSYNFLVSQSEINYSSLILEEDLHKKIRDEKIDLQYLNQLEKEYGLPTLWPYITLDRIVISNQLAREYPYNKPKYNHEEILKLVQVTAKTVISFLDKEKPDYMVISAMGTISGLLLYEIAKKRGIKILNITANCLPFKCVLSERFEYLTWVEEIFKKNNEHLSLVEKNPNYKESARFLEGFRL